MKVWLKKTRWQYSPISAWSREDEIYYSEGTEYDEGDLVVAKDRMVVTRPTYHTEEPVKRGKAEPSPRLSGPMVLLDVSKPLFQKLCERGYVEIADPQVRTKQ